MAGRQTAKKAPLELVVERRSLVDRAAHVMRQQILNGSFGPGFRLTETWLAEQMQLSRATVRAALRELTHEGLIRSIPYTGWVVSELTARDAWELCTVRGALEALAARLAAEAISAERAERLEAVYDRMREAARSGSRRRVVEADLTLHKTILDLAGNRRLIEQYERIEQQIQLYVALSDLRSDLDEVVTWHASLVAAITQGDAAAAERIAKENAERNGQDLIKQLERHDHGSTSGGSVEPLGAFPRESSVGAHRSTAKRSGRRAGAGDRKSSA